jgi:hypothetical protein
MDNEKILDEIRRLCDPYSLLVIHGNKLQKVTVSFPRAVACRRYRLEEGR